MPPLSFQRQPAFAGSTLGLIVLLALAACGRDGAGPGAGPDGERPPTPVTYMTVRGDEVRVDAEYAGRVHGTREAEVRARVGGLLEARLYDEGEVVEEGAALFRIEQAPYRIGLQRTEAEKANAQAAVNQARREWQRISGLYEQRAISERERDRALSELELAQASLDLAEAGVAQARLDLGYTFVSAPVSGVTSLEALTAGNLIEPGALLTAVTQIDPVQVRFSLPERDAATRRMLASDAPDEWLEARVLFPDGSLYTEPGTIDFTASTVDPRTGTVMARALFPNPEQRLMPGTLVRVRIAMDRLADAYPIDAEAVSQGPQGPLVFVVDDEDVARARDVRLGPLVNGRQVVLEGIEDGDRVIVNGQVALRDGARVAPQARDGRTE